MQHVGELFAYFYAKLGERRGRPHDDLLSAPSPRRRWTASGSRTTRS
jgi:hypothetical protein